MKNLTHAILVAQKSLDHVSKDARNAFHKFNYVSAEAMITDCRAALHEAGLVLLTLKSTVDGNTLRCTYLLMCGEESLEMTFDTPAVEGSGRPLDKAFASSSTTNLSYFLRGLLLVPRVEEGADMNTRNDTNHTPVPNYAALISGAKTIEDLAKVQVAIQGSSLSEAERDKLRVLWKNKQQTLSGK